MERNKAGQGRKKSKEGDHLRSNEDRKESLQSKNEKKRVERKI